MQQQMDRSDSNHGASTRTHPHHKRKSVPVKRETATVKENLGVNNHQDASQHGIENTHGAVNPTTVDADDNTAPLSSNSKLKKRTLDHISPSASASAPTPTRNNKSSKMRRPSQQNQQSTTPVSTALSTRHNLLIHDFFKAAVKKKSTNSRIRNTDSSSKNNVATGSKGIQATIQQSPRSSAPLESKSTPIAISSTTSYVVAASTSSKPITAKNAAALEELQQRYHELERQYQDKEAQLQAVSNNRTILHSALQSALTKRETELKRCQAEHALALSRRERVLEDLVRNDAAQQATDLRDKLAMEAARLGKIVYTRAGMRTVEVWEDGYASKQLQERRKKLRKVTAILEKRQEAALAAAERIDQQSRDGDAVKDETSSSTTELIGGVHVRTPLEAREAVASVKNHLRNMLRQQDELEKEEKALNDEKVAHIRALKRVACEDSSRFKTRPKVSIFLLDCCTIPMTITHIVTLARCSCTTATFSRLCLARADFPKCGVPMI